MKIQLLHTEDCHTWQLAESQLRAALKESGLAESYQVILIESQGQAEKYHFLGSPQVLINGQDVDPMAQGVKNFSATSCRPYFYQGKSYDFPPKEIILTRLREVNR